MAAVTAILSRYPETVITSVTHPATGLPSKKGWLPTVKEVSDACEENLEPIVQNEARQKRIREQFEMREREASGEKPALDQLKEKYGDDWGLSRLIPQKISEARADENRAAFMREQGRVRAEYEHLGLNPPSALALSPTALREMAERDAMRNEMLGRNHGEAVRR